MTSSDAQTILDLIECATDDNWPKTVNSLTDMGYNGTEVVAATKALAELGQRSNPLDINDF